MSESDTNQEQQIKILVVEDEAITALDIQTRLEKLGYGVPAISSNGKDALSKIKKIQPHLILMDIVLKGTIDGIEIAKHIAKKNHIPVIFITANKDNTTFHRAKLSEPYGYLTKPFETRDLYNAIELALCKYKADLKIFSAEKRYRTIMENASCGIIIQDPQGIILDVNQHAEELFNLRKNEILHQDFHEFLVPEEQDYLTMQLKKLRLEKKIGPSTCHLQLSNGEIKDIEFSAVYIENGNNFIIGILNDLSERNRLREQTLLSDKLATVGTLAAGIIHEINNPMTWILTNLNYVKDQLELLTTKTLEHKKMLENLHQVCVESIHGAERIKDIVLNLKSFAHNQQEKINAADIHEILYTAINIAQSQFAANIKLKTKFAVDIPPLFLNAGKLQQVFLNLIVNAAQALEENPERSNNIFITTQLKQQQILITIKDTGKGIAPDILDKIFDPFYTTKPIGIGTGLGLSICLEIINNLGGKIFVDSKLNIGTTFSIFLPLELRMPPTLISSHDNNLFKNIRILIIDDDATMRTTLKNFLTNHYKITLKNGREAVDLLYKKIDFDVIISGIEMQDINGIDLYDYITKKFPGLERKIIFTAKEKPKLFIQEFLKKITNDCLLSPLIPHELQQALEKIIIENSNPAPSSHVNAEDPISL